MFGYHTGMATNNPLRKERYGKMPAPQGGAGFNPLAAGKKSYGSGRPMPTSGKIVNKAGYGKRDARAAARRDALIRRGKM